jgi:hypothetical protein
MAVRVVGERETGAAAPSTPAARARRSLRAAPHLVVPTVLPTGVVLPSAPNAQPAGSTAVVALCGDHTPPTRTRQLSREPKPAGTTHAARVRRVSVVQLLVKKVVEGESRAVASAAWTPPLAPNESEVRRASSVGRGRGQKK